MRRREAAPSAHDCAEGGLAVALAECCFDTAASASRSTCGPPEPQGRRHRHAVRRVRLARRRVGGAASDAGGWQLAARAGVPAAVIGGPAGRCDCGGRQPVDVDEPVDGRRGSGTGIRSRAVRASARRWVAISPACRRGRSRENWGMRQVQRRVRRLRDLRPPRGGEPHLSRPLRLQHRGQESAGIASSDGTRSASSAGDGPRRRRLRQRDARRAEGHLAIGHVRYSTAGESRLANAQPILIDCAHGQMAIVGHNGNLVNAGEVRDELVRDGVDLPDQQRHRGGAAPVRAVAAAQRRGGARRTPSRRCAARSRSS